MFTWFADSLVTQYENNVVTDQIIIIDSCVEYDDTRVETLKATVDGRFDYIHMAPKPSIWRGRHKKTKGTYYDVSGTRNTGLILCDTEYIVFVDDLSVLMPNWLTYHKNAAEKNIIFVGAYDKVSDIVFENRMFKSYSRFDMDSRMASQPTDESIKVCGGWIFGSNAGFPTECIYKINGYDEFYARRGCEDCNLGVRLENAGYKDLIYYNKNCLIIEDQDMHYTGENDPNLDLNYTLRQYSYSAERNYQKHATCSAAMTKIESDSLYVRREYLTLNPYFNLEKEKELYRTTKTFRSVENDTFVDFDGDTLADL